jgi:RNA polymerase sigma-70 factor (ECF subfamily)
VHHTAPVSSNSPQKRIGFQARLTAGFFFACNFIRHKKRALDAALALRQPGPYQAQAAIAALHASASTAAQTDWRQIAQLYRALLRYWPTPVVELNAAVAVGMADGYEHGLRLIDAVEARGELARSHYLYAARAGRLRRLERNAEAAAAFDQALSLVANEVERDYLKQQREALPLTATAPSRRR